MFSGSLVAIVTPFKEGGEIDVKAFADLIEFQIANGTDGIVPCGTTGESATLSHEEHERIIYLTVKLVKKRVPVIAGTGSNSTREALRLTKCAQKVGADAALLITPYYNKPTQEGLYRHYKTIAQKVDLPLIMYNVPGRTAVNMLPETVARLAEFKNIVGIKEASANLAQITDIARLCRERLILLSGDDFTILPTLAMGGRGVISVVANIVPADVAALIDAFNAGDLEKAKELQFKLMPLCSAMFIETNPIPVKTALALMGKIQQGLRLPLCDMSEGNLKKLKSALQDYGLI
ncbi:MAG: 4-hydroxy-tetrahydrodipicolinate synthase [Candidatus Schekmanbacteria bacterium]|nr:4-hydroxy-tetrahydrodipicolinate synthase [Candidatus Schekmanbacteria bacterium]